MAKRVASRAYNINDLPDEVLGHTISFLSIKEVVRTSIVSRRWRYLFTFLSSLDLDMDIDDENERKCFMKFLDRLVLHPDEPSILRFGFRRHQFTNRQGDSLWICGLRSCSIQELDIWLNNKISDGLGLQQNLFSCESLVVLKLNLSWETYDLKIPASIGLLHVKVLHIHAIVFPNDGTEELLFSSFPVLEDLVLYECELTRGCVKFSVSNQNLKRLSLERILFQEKRPVDVLINAPNLIFLSYSISSYYSLKLIDVKSLATAVIDSSKSLLHGGYDHNGVSGALRQIINIQTLKINYSVLRVLEHNKVPIPSLDKLTCLKIWGWEYMFDIVWLEYFLTRCVVLETLVFEKPLKKSRIKYSLQDSRLGPSVRRLKTIEFKFFQVSQAKAFVPVMGFFMENAGVLEKLKIYCKQGCPKIHINMIAGLGLFRRVSGRCGIQFYHT